MRYPATFSVEYPGRLSRRLALVRWWLLAIPHYLRGIFDLVLAMNRSVLRVAAYAGLMTDRYPPFRMDIAAGEPRAMTVPPPGRADAASRDAESSAS